MPRMNGERPKCQGEQPRTTLSSALQDFKGKSNVSMKAVPKKPPEGSASRMGPTWGYSAKLVQGKYVPFTHYVTPFFRPKAYKVRVGGISPQCGIEQIHVGGS